MLQNRMDTEKKDLGDKWQSCLKVALMHHHVVHYPGQQTEHKGYEFMVDSPRVLEFLESFDFDIVLTGHKHQPYERVERFKNRDMFIIGGPTVGGYTSSYRGFRLVEFESDQSVRRVEIKDIRTDFADVNTAEEYANAGQFFWIARLRGRPWWSGPRPRKAIGIANRHRSPSSRPTATRKES